MMQAAAPCSQAPTPCTQVLSVAPGSAAAAAGLRVGQRLLAVDGAAVQTSEYAGALLSLALVRDSAAPSVAVRVRPPAVERLPSGVQAACRAAADARGSNGCGDDVAARPGCAASAAGGDGLECSSGFGGGGGGGALRLSGLNISGVRSAWGPAGYNAAGAAAEATPTPKPTPSMPPGGVGSVGGAGGGVTGTGDVEEGEEGEEDEEDAPSAPSMPFAEGSGVDSLDVAWQAPCLIGPQDRTRRAACWARRVAGRAR